MRLGRLRSGLWWVVGMVMSFSATAAFACTTVALGLPHKPLIAYSFDYAATGAGLVFVNPAQASRSSIMDTPAQWTVRHGSVTFNQMGPGMPAAGMNTAGLVVSLMWNDEAVFSRGGTAPVVTELEFIQRLLDTSASVDEALSVIHDVRIQGFVPIHFFLADRTGNTAIVTPTPGGMTIHKAEDMPVPALTNTSYSMLTDRLRDFRGFGGEMNLPRGENPGSLQRFLIAAEAVREADGPVTSKMAFAALARVANQSSRWQIVFDPTGGLIEYRIVGRQRAHRLNMSKIDFGCRQRPLAVAVTGEATTNAMASLEPAEPSAVSSVSREVLASLPQGAGLGPQMADGLTAGLLAALRCEP